jgi:alpha-1,2-mannosyltransferase
MGAPAPAAGPRPASVGRRPATVAFAAAILGLLLIGLVLAARLVAELAVGPAVDGHHDVLAFWAAGRLILDGRPDALYDAATVTALQRTVIPEPIGMNGYMPFINPPPAAVAFAPLAALPVTAGRALWAALNAALAIGAGLWIARDLSLRDRVLGAALIATSFPVYHALAEGQWSIVLLAAGLVAVAAARRGSWPAAGVALAAFWLKPQFIVLPLFALVIGRHWRAVGAAVVAGAVVALVLLPFTGLSPYGTYAAYLVDVVTSHFTGAGQAGAAVWQGDLASTEGLNGLLVGWFGQGAVGSVNALWAAGVMAVLVAYGLAARRVRPGLGSPDGRAMLAAGVVVILLVNPNQFVQDCVLVYLALEVLAPIWPAWRLPGLVAAVAIADLTFLDQQAPVLHLFPIALLVGLAWTCGRALTGGRVGWPVPDGALPATGPRAG